MSFGFVWDFRARRAIAAELLRRFPYKAPSIHEDRGAVSCILEDITMAWRAYDDGAAAALFDLSRFITEAGLPLPDAIEGELASLARWALGGDGMTGGRGSRPPLQAHLAALCKRQRNQVMAEVLLSGWHYRDMDDPRGGAISQGADPELFAQWKLERPEASEVKMHAAALAQRKLREAKLNPPSDRAIYDDFSEVERARMDKATWPGRFYLPSPATCETLDWGAELAFLLKDEPSEGPAWIVP